MMFCRTFVGLAAMLLVAACASGPSTGTPPTGESQDTAPASTNGPTTYQAVGAVLESSAHGPELCSAVLESLPPQCGGVPIAGWDWAIVDGEQQANDTTWIDTVQITGAFDGTTFTLASARVPTAEVADVGPPPDERHAPCTEPEGGWEAQGAKFVPPTSGGSHALYGPVNEYVAAQPDGAGTWIDWMSGADLTSGDNDPTKMIFVAQFTGDLARHEADLRQIWTGALCVAEAPLTSEALKALAAEITTPIRDGRLTLDNGITLRLISWGMEGNPATGTVDLDVIFAPPEAQAYFDAKYGPGRVVLRAQIQPVP